MHAAAHAHGLAVACPFNFCFQCGAQALKRFFHFRIFVGFAPGQGEAARPRMPLVRWGFKCVKSGGGVALRPLEQTGIAVILPLFLWLRNG